jgi:hypothetical protein
MLSLLLLRRLVHQVHPLPNSANHPSFQCYTCCEEYITAGRVIYVAQQGGLSNRYLALCRAAKHKDIANLLTYKPKQAHLPNLTPPDFTSLFFKITE